MPLSDLPQLDQLAWVWPLRGQPLWRSPWRTSHSAGEKKLPHTQEIFRVLGRSWTWSNRELWTGTAWWRSIRWPRGYSASMRWKFEDDHQNKFSSLNLLAISYFGDLRSEMMFILRCSQTAITQSPLASKWDSALWASQVLCIFHILYLSLFTNHSCFNWFLEGEDIWKGNKTLTLALTWQLMRAYTLSLLKRDKRDVTEEEIIAWANKEVSLFLRFAHIMLVLGWDHIFFIKMSKIPRKVSNQEEKSGKTHTIKDFKDKEAIKTALPVLDLIDCIKPGTVDYSNVVDKPDSTDEVE